MEISDIRIRENIKALREAYGLTQGQLAERFGSDDHQYISNFERGKNKVDDETKLLYMKCFEVTLEELMFSDLSGFKVNYGDPKSAKESLKKCFPYFDDDNALKEEPFSNAYYSQQAFYTAWESIPFEEFDPKIGLDTFVDNTTDSFLSLIESLNRYKDILDNYLLSYKNELAKDFVAANYISFFYVLNIIRFTVSVFTDKKALSYKLCKDYKIDPSLIDEMAAAFTTELERFIPIDFSVLEEPIYKSAFDEMMIQLKKEPLFANLADYYDALTLFFIKPGGTIFNQNGYDRLKKLSSCNNIYAMRYLRFNPNPADSEKNKQ